MKIQSMTDLWKIQIVQGVMYIESIWVLKFPQVESSLQLERKVALDQVGYENEAKGVKSLKM